MSRLLIECGAADTRAVLINDGIAKEFWFGPARGDETLVSGPEAGAIFAGRVRSVSAALAAAFVDIGEARDAFLQFRKGEKPPIEGALEIFVVHRPPIGDKGAVLSRGWRKGLSAGAVADIEKDQRKVGPVTVDGVDAAASVVKLFAAGAENAPFEIIINDAAAARAIAQLTGLQSRLAKTSVAERPFAEFDVDVVISASLQPVVALPGGARLQFAETPGGVVIDVDTAGAATGAAARLDDRTNETALARLFPELRRRAVGGRVIVDFLPPSDASARKSLAAQVQSALAEFPKARFGALARDGLCDFTLPRRRRSLLEQASEPYGAGLLVSGRRATLDWAAKSAIRALEAALFTSRAGRPQLIAGAEIGSYIDGERPQWRERLAQKFGARFTIETAADGCRIAPRGYDLAE